MAEMKNTRRKRNLVVALVIAACTAAFAFWWLSLSDSPVMVTIPPGASARAVAIELRRMGVISSETLFVQLAHASGLSKKLKAGSYALSPRMSALKILRLLLAGKARYIRVTVPEGFTAKQIASLMETQGVITDAQAFLAAVEKDKLEGYLFPETYFFEARTGVDRVIGRMQGEFRRRFTPELQARAQAVGMSERDAVTLASIIEKEAVRQEEQPLISGVFHNRLRKHWYLESCATVQFALGEHKPKLTFKDTQVSSPYNTYRHTGLPPGPICSPGAGALRAALFPAETDDLFFVASSSGTHMFSRYFSEHVRNKLKSKRALRK